MLKSELSQQRRKIIYSNSVYITRLYRIYIPAKISSFEISNLYLLMAEEWHKLLENVSNIYLNLTERETLKEINTEL